MDKRQIKKKKKKNTQPQYTQEEEKFKMKKNKWHSKMKLININSSPIKNLIDFFQNEINKKISCILLYLKRKMKTIINSITFYLPKTIKHSFYKWHHFKNEKQKKM